MARKRMIDPSIWTDEDVGRLTPLQRLIYIGTISLADDEGRLKGSPEFIKATLLPYDESIRSSHVNDCLEKLSKKLLLRYKKNDQLYLAHKNWTTYQYIEKARPSILPAPPGWTSPPIPLRVGERSPPIQSATQQQKNPSKEKSTQECLGIDIAKLIGQGKSDYDKSLLLLLKCCMDKKASEQYALKHKLSDIESIYPNAVKARNPGGYMRSSLDKLG